jgi:hypothetical protein
MLHFVELTHANPHWLLTGSGDKYHDRVCAGGFRGGAYFSDR